MRSTRSTSAHHVQAPVDAGPVWLAMDTRDRLAWIDRIVTSSPTVSQFDLEIDRRQIDDSTLDSLAFYEFGRKPVPESGSHKYQCLNCDHQTYRKNMRAHIWPAKGGRRCDFWKAGDASSRLREFYPPLASVADVGVQFRQDITPLRRQRSFYVAGGSLSLIVPVHVSSRSLSIVVPVHVPIRSLAIFFPNYAAIRTCAIIILTACVLVGIATFKSTTPSYKASSVTRQSVIPQRVIKDI
jgi:hypothetical protein